MRRNLRPSDAAAALAIFALGAGAVAFAGCKDNGASPSASPAPCTRVGQTCEFSPNKLGSCVQRDDCTKDCLVCQSQH